jgi:hypothetical protein
MRVSGFAVFALLLALGLSSCSSVEPLTAFPIAGGPLKADELKLEEFSNVAFSSRVFDVVNQDMTSEGNTGLAGKVDPGIVDILSRYAAHKFRAAGGVATTRLVIRQAQFQVRSVKGDNETWFTDATPMAEMVATVTVMLTSAQPDGNGSSITANTTQVSQLSPGSSPEERREAYLQLMERVLKALDAEFTKQLPMYFSDVVAR